MTPDANEPGDDVHLWQHTLRHDGDTVEILLSGELDMACSPALQEMFADNLRAPNATGVRVDLSEVTFLDSTILGILVSGYRDAQTMNRTFTITNPSTPAQRLLTLTGLTNLLSTTP